MTATAFRRDLITKPIFRWASARAAAACPIPSARRSRRATSGGTPSFSPAIRIGRSCSRAAGDAVGRGAGVPRRPGRRTLRACSTTGRSTGSCAICRRTSGNSSRRRSSSRMIIPKEYGGLGFSAYAHSEVVRKIVDALGDRRGHRDGAELARPGRIAAAVRHQGAARLLAAAARRRRGNSLLRADQPGSGLGCRVDDRLRRRLSRAISRAARCSASG